MSLQWVNVSFEQVAGQIAERLKELLEERSVVWWVSGGSNIGPEIASLKWLQQMATDLSKLTILLIDERFGAVGHKDSNWTQLEDKGFMIHSANYIPPFKTEHRTLAEATAYYKQTVDEVLAGDAYMFAQLGMGGDGHTAGILPGSIAAEETTDNVVGYQWSDYQRITLTFAALCQLDEVALVSYGKSKWPQLVALSQSLAVNTQPVQIIKDIERCTIY